VDVAESCPDLAVGPGFPVLDLTVPLVQPASIVAITAAVTRTEPRRVGRMTPLSMPEDLPVDVHIPPDVSEVRDLAGPLASPPSRLARYPAASRPELA
jgi:hypothetical protein